jgi:hypothetical protein
MADMTMMMMVATTAAAQFPFNAAKAAFLYS